MSIFLNKDNKVIVQGITGGEGTKHTALMLKAGTNVVGGVTRARPARQSATSTPTVTPSSCRSSRPSPRPSRRPGRHVDRLRAAGLLQGRHHRGCRRGDPAVGGHHRGHPGAGLRVRVGLQRRQGGKTRIIGPNCPGIITPGEALVGITPNNITGKGPIGLVSKSGTLTYQMMYELRDLGFSTAIGIGGDPVIGTTHIDAIEAFEKDPETKLIVMIGEIGGDAEERAAAYIQANVTAGRRPRRRVHRAGGQDHGPRGRDRVRQLGYRPGEEGSPRGGRREGRQDAERDRSPGPGLFENLA